MSQYDDRSWYPPMASGQGTPAYPVSCNSTPYSPSAAFQMAKLGTLIGLTGAGAMNLHRYQQGELAPSEAALNTLRAGVASGLATAAATLVASQFRSPTLAIAATLVTGTAAMYALNAPAPSKPDQAPDVPGIETDAEPV